MKELRGTTLFFSQRIPRWDETFLADETRAELEGPRKKNVPCWFVQALRPERTRVQTDGRLGHRFYLSDQPWVPQNLHRVHRAAIGWIRSHNSRKYSERFIKINVFKFPQLPTECEPWHISELLHICLIGMVQFQELIEQAIHTKEAQNLRIPDMNIWIHKGPKISDHVSKL